MAADGLIYKENSENGKKRIDNFMVYPNPSNGIFSAEVNLTERGNISIKIFSFANNAMIASKKDSGELSYHLPFDLSGLPSGVYAVLLETSYGNTLRKVILE
ncbi:MAG: T9SS type A sorting domain-containing protein [Pricia sp.]|nr:T9SS type A sorting domain-containing protein [Pricia sp.]